MEYKDQGEVRRFQSYHKDRQRRRKWDQMRPDLAHERKRSAEEHAAKEAEKKGGTLLLVVIVLALLSYAALMFLSGK